MGDPPGKYDMYGVCLMYMVSKVSSGEYGMYATVFHGVSSTMGWGQDG